MVQERNVIAQVAKADPCRPSSGFNSCCSSLDFFKNKYYLLANTLYLKKVMVQRFQKY